MRECQLNRRWSQVFVCWQSVPAQMKMHWLQMTATQIVMICLSCWDTICRCGRHHIYLHGCESISFRSFFFLLWLCTDAIRSVISLICHKSTWISEKINSFRFAKPTFLHFKELKKMWRTLIIIYFASAIILNDRSFAIYLVPA